MVGKDLPQMGEAFASPMAMSMPAVEAALRKHKQELHDDHEYFLKVGNHTSGLLKVDFNSSNYGLDLASSCSTMLRKGHRSN